MENSYKIKNIVESKKQRPITFRATKRYEKKISATCKILSGNEGSGFFCEIKVNNKLMKVLFTNNHVINDLNSDIKIEHNRKKKIIKLNNRFKYTNQELDYTCIEILEEDGINNYFKIDKNINNNNPYEEYKYDEFVMIQYPGGDDVSFAQGYINNIKDENIIYTMKTEYGSSGSPLILDTRNLTDMIGMFSGCSNLKELNVSNFDTSKVVNMFGMFSGCKSLKELDLSNFNTINVDSMYSMFNNCFALEKLDLSNFNTDKVRTFYCMFNQCKSLKDLKFPNLNINYSANRDYMFEGCEKLNEDWKMKIKDIIGYCICF